MKDYRSGDTAKKRRKPFLPYLSSWTALVFLLFSLTSAQAQFFQQGPSANLESGLDADLQGLEVPAEKVDFLLSQIEEIYLYDRRQAFQLALKAKTIAKFEGLQTMEVQSLFWCIQTGYEDNVWREQLRWAKVALVDALERFPPKLSIQWKGRFWVLLSTIAYLLEEDQPSKDYNDQFFDLYQEEGSNVIDSTTVGDAYRTRANLFYVVDKQLDSMQFCYDQALLHYARQTKPNHSRIALVYMNQGIVARFQKQFNESNAFFEKSVSNCPLRDSILRGEILLEWAHNLAAIARSFNYDSLLLKRQIFRQSNEFLWRAEQLDSVMNARIYYQLGANHQNLALSFIEEPTSPHYAAILDSAFQFYSLSVQSAMRENNLQVLDKLDDSAVKLFELGQLAQNQSLSKQINAAYLDIYKDMLALGDTQLMLQEAENQLVQEQEKQKRNRLGWIFLLLFIITGAAFFSYYQRKRFQELKQRLDIRMEALRSQMNSHFISNTLNAIDSLIMEGKRTEASGYIVAFSRLCRNILNSSKKAFIGLDEEIDILKGYLHFEKLRLGDRLNIEWDIDPTLDLSAHLVPSLILQPFVENAIWHGILKKEDRTPGELTVSILHHSPEQLKCIILDDGIGRKKAKELRNNQAIEWQSWGMKITNERIEALKHIRDAEITFEDLYDAKGRGVGTKVVILLPKQLNEL